MKKPLFALLLLLAGIICVRADIIPSFVGTSGANDDTSTVWSYKIDITAEQNATSGDFFTIYDFSSVVPTATAQPAGWTFSTSLVGVTPAQTNPSDDPSLYNLTWTYSGPTIAGSSSAGQNIGPFSVSIPSAFNVEVAPASRAGQFAAQGTLASGTNAGSKVNNIGAVPVPAAIPEPSTVALIFGTGGLGLVGRALARRRR
jgi:hypothetical protein